MCTIRIFLKIDHLIPVDQIEASALECLYEDQLPLFYSWPQKRQQEFISGRLLLRELMSSPQKFFIPAQGEKPQLPDVSFSISHSHGLVAVAMTREKLELGLDIELLSEKKDIQRLAHRILSSSEYQEFLKENSSFYKFWTLKEAIIKTQGNHPPRPYKEITPSSCQIYQRYLRDSTSEQYYCLALVWPLESKTELCLQHSPSMKLFNEGQFISGGHNR